MVAGCFKREGSDVCCSRRRGVHRSKHAARRGARARADLLESVSELRRRRTTGDPRRPAVCSERRQHRDAAPTWSRGRVARAVRTLRLDRLCTPRRRDEVWSLVLRPLQCASAVSATVTNIERATAIRTEDRRARLAAVAAARWRERGSRAALRPAGCRGRVYTIASRAGDRSDMRDIRSGRRQRPRARLIGALVLRSRGLRRRGRQRARRDRAVQRERTGPASCRPA